ncbi:ATP-binding protein [Draconibacterium halophilum]|uniref:ATP-binding protein n=1 Tax=Draconibacterium halophilum TaxID=2706887 RepID=A0A6C0RDQ8_9BACT|nr:ATP-binding protein [Draconibacterium halophilum]QIA08470.1 ATP-binding protein [Draconibacterium halophilum]
MGTTTQISHGVLNVVQHFVESAIRARLNRDFGKEEALALNVPDFAKHPSILSGFIIDNQLKKAEILCLLLALVPYISPGLISTVVGNYLPNGGDFPDFGGVKGKNHRGILPTGETVLYILAGRDMDKRVKLSTMFEDDHLFTQKSVLHIEPVPSGEPKMSGRLVLDDEFVDLFTSGKISRPKLSGDFPAQLIATKSDWADLVLKDKTLEEIKELEIWLNHNEQLMNEWDMRDKIKPGFRVLFFGPSGTGKTMTACLLGKYTGRDVYRVDLSMVISKYIGETEKNLSGLFNKAEHKNWILFFDEADSLFGKRTNVRDAHDKYANQEVSYLLQRIEAHHGLVILASNMKGNIDSAFTRRFNAFVEFDLPEFSERLKLWQVYMPKSNKVNKDIYLEELAKNYELTGANIVNVIHYAGLLTIKKKNPLLDKEALLAGIRKEYKKEGKILRQ